MRKLIMHTVTWKRLVTVYHLTTAAILVAHTIE